MLDNPYLVDGYAPVDAEIVADELEVIGEIPLDLSGLYARNGPNPRFAPQGRYHWFDGDGMIHAVRLRDGKASYRNRWVRTEGFEREEDAARVLWRGVMEPKGDNPDDGSRLRLKDTANTDLVFHDGSLVATWYLAGEPYAVDPLTLETRGKENWQGTRRCLVSAHPKVDEHTGELLFFDYGPRRPFLQYGVVSAERRLAHLVPIDLPGPRMPHDMAITEHHTILMDLPLIADPAAAARGRHKIVFDRSMPSRFAVIPRYGSPDEVRWFEASPCYIYHTVNAWEEGDEIVMDVCRVKRPQPPEHATTPLAKMLSYLRLDARLYRYRFNLVTGTTREEERDDTNTEFPTIHAGKTGRPTRYAYNVSITNDSTLLFDGIVKYDNQKGTSERYAFGDGRFGSEAPFAPRPGASAEDDGYLVSFVYDARERRSELVILDAADFGAGPIGRVLLPQRVPLGFHACFVPQERLGAAGL